MLLGIYSLILNVVRTLRDRTTGARAEHPLVICRIAPDNKRMHRAPKQKIKIFHSGVGDPRPRYTQKDKHMEQCTNPDCNTLVRTMETNACFMTRKAEEL